MMVEGLPIGVSPPSRYTDTALPSCCLAAMAVVGGSWPEMLAEDTAMGPTSRSSSMATGCSGMRSMTVPRVSPRFHGSEGACGTTMDSPPGQNALTRDSVIGGYSRTRPRMVSQEPTSTGTGMSGPRRLVTRRVATAWLSKASQPGP